VVVGTVKGTLVNTVRRLGKDLAGNPVFAIRAAIAERKREILSISPAYKNDVIPFTISGKVPFDQSPFISEQHIPPAVEVDFSTKSRETPASEILDQADEPSRIDIIMKDLEVSGMSAETMKKVRDALQKLPQTYLSEQNLPATLQGILIKVDPQGKSVLRRPTPQVRPEKKQRAAEIILNLSNTVFSSGRLADRLMPTPATDQRKLNANAEEMISYLHQIAAATKDLRQEAAAYASDPSAISNIRHLLSLAKEYNTQLLRAINKSKDLAERVSESAEPIEFDHIRDTMPASKEKIAEFISRMSQASPYKAKPEIIKRVNQALNSLVDPKDLPGAIEPRMLQVLFMELATRAKAGDEFDNLLLEIEKYRARNTLKESGAYESRSEEGGVGSLFREMGEKYESDINIDQFQSYTPSRGGGDS
jgi:hypothetical protein